MRRHEARLVLRGLDAAPERFVPGRLLILLHLDAREGTSTPLRVTTGSTPARRTTTSTASADRMV